MKSKNNNSKPARESLLKAVGPENAPDADFLAKLKTRSMQEFENAAATGDPAPRSFESPWRHIMKNRITQVTSAAVILIAALVGIHMFVGGGVRVTFADVVKPILNATTISYDFIVGDETDGVVLHDIVTEDRIRRTMDGAIMIVDLDKLTMLRLDTKRNEAAYLDVKGPLGHGMLGFNKFVRQLRGLLDDPDFEPEELGEKDIDGQKAVGFRAGGDGGGIVIWADAETAMPIRVELGLAHQAFIIKDFEFDFPLDVSLVSMEVPQGYTLKETDMDLSNVTERDFIAGLKVWVEVLSGGKFPDSLSPKDYMQNIPVMEEKIGALNLSEEEAEMLGSQYIKSMMFVNLFMVQGHSEPTYVGKGATYGDHDTAVFWYKPKDSENYRVIYADLSVKDVPADQLPQ